MILVNSNMTGDC